MMQNNPAPALLRFIFSSLLLGMMAVYGVSLLSVDVPIDLQARYLPPGASHWFGTDNMGRDLWLRCFQGALTSLQIGVGAAICSGVIAMLIASLTLIHPVMDQALRLIIDTLLSLPHLLLLILICFTVGGGMRGVVLAVAFTHWPKLALILRAEAQQIRTSDYMTLAQRIGNTRWYCWRAHYLPALSSQWLVGTLLMFPHAVLHSAALSFLGFGLAPHDPSLGILLADALRFFSNGSWWLALYPGLMLLLIVLLFDLCVRAIRDLWLRNPSC